jgi:hypothetical protein
MIIITVTFQGNRLVGFERDEFLVTSFRKNIAYRRNRDFGNRY